MNIGVTLNRNELTDVLESPNLFPEITSGGGRILPMMSRPIDDFILMLKS